MLSEPAPAGHPPARLAGALVQPSGLWEFAVVLSVVMDLEQEMLYR